MDIQRGDQVYYRGEVWTVRERWAGVRYPDTLVMTRLNSFGREEELHVYIDEVQRVEQVR